MRDSFLQDYSREHVHFYDEGASALLHSGLILVRESSERPRIVDLGCGDGRLVFALYKQGFLEDTDEIVGVDLSQPRIERLSKELPFVRTLISDASDVKELSHSSFDYIICSQLIEHVKNDGSLLLEIRRLLRNKGLAYISSVIRKRYGFYIYHHGSFRLDPTHAREYSSQDELIEVIENNGFRILSVRTRQVALPVLDSFVRLLIRMRVMKPNQRFFVRNTYLLRMRMLRIPVVGYKSIEVLAEKNA